MLQSFHSFICQEGGFFCGFQTIRDHLSQYKSFHELIHLIQLQLISGRKEELSDKK